jgi:hypothetical protein
MSCYRHPELRLKIGTLVHFVLGDGMNKGQCRPAIVTEAWHETVATLTVFCTGPDDCCGTAGLPFVASSVSYSAHPMPGTWHFPEGT